MQSKKHETLVYECFEIRFKTVKIFCLDRGCKSDVHRKLNPWTHVTFWTQVRCRVLVLVHMDPRVRVCVR